MSLAMNRKIGFVIVLTKMFLLCWQFRYWKEVWIHPWLTENGLYSKILGFASIVIMMCVSFVNESFRLVLWVVRKRWKLSNFRILEIHAPKCLRWGEGGGGRRREEDGMMDGSSLFPLLTSSAATPLGRGIAPSWKPWILLINWERNRNGHKFRSLAKISDVSFC